MKQGRAWVSHGCRTDQTSLRGWNLLLALAWVLAALPAQSVDLDYSDVPLFWATGAPPNVMLTLDENYVMSSLAYNDAFRARLRNPTSTVNDIYMGDWKPCNQYDNANSVCTSSFLDVWYLVNDTNNVFTLEEHMADGLFSPMRCSMSTGLPDNNGGGVLWGNAGYPGFPGSPTGIPNPMPYTGSAIPLVTRGTGARSQQRVVNACIKFKTANTAVPGGTTHVNAPGYPKGARHDGKTRYVNGYLNHLLNEHFLDGPRDELSCCPPAPDATAHPNRLIYDMTTDPKVPDENRLQEAREVALTLVKQHAGSVRFGLARFNEQEGADGIAVNCDAGTRAHIAELTRQINTQLKPTRTLSPQARDLQKIHDWFASANSPLQYRCQKNYTISLLGSLPSGDFTDADNKDFDGSPDRPWDEWNTILVLDDVAEVGYGADYKTGGLDAAGKSWDDPSEGGKNAKQNITPYIVAPGLPIVGGWDAPIKQGALRYAPLVNRITVPAIDIITATEAPPFGSIRIPNHGLKLGDPVLYETVSKQADGSFVTKTVGRLTIRDSLSGREYADNGQTRTAPLLNTSTPNPGYGVFAAIPIDTDHIALALNYEKAAATPPVGEQIVGAGSDTHTFSTGPGKFYFTLGKDELTEALGNVMTAINAANLSVTAVSIDSSKTGTKNRIYQSRFTTQDWSGSITAYKLNPVTGAIDIATPAWIANREGGTLGGNVLTLNPSLPGAKGIKFEWASLSGTQRAALHDVDTLNWIKQGTWVAGKRRKPAGLLGDIINSNLEFVGATDEKNSSLPGAEGSSYAGFLAAKSSRTSVLFFGANDGMLHGLNISMNGNADIGQGQELVAYIPNAVYQNFTDTNDNGVMDGGVETAAATDKLYQLSLADYGKSSNPHQYFVDGGLTSSDAYWGGAWHTVVVGALGSGGRGIYALDATDANFTASDVLWERSEDSNSVDASTTKNSLGYTYCKPVIGRMANGEWAAIVGNGYDSAGDKAQLFIIRLSDGSVIKQIDTKAGGSASPNGMSSVAVILGGSDNRTVQAIYGGDLHGNVWKFDVSSATASNWQVAYGTTTNPRPLFAAIDADGRRQPITGGLVTKSYNGGVMVFVGTGKLLENGDNIYPPVSAADSRVNTMYGLFDNGSAISSRADLVQQTMNATLNGAGTSAGTVYRTGSNNDVNYTTKRGWYLDLQVGVVREGERVVGTPVLNDTRLIFTTLTSNNIDPCSNVGKSALMELYAFSGGTAGEPVFDTNGDGEVDRRDAHVVGMQANTILSAPQILTFTDLAGKVKELKIMGASSASTPIVSVKESPVGGVGKLSTGRLMWSRL